MIIVEKSKQNLGLPQWPIPEEQEAATRGEMGLESGRPLVR